MVTFCRKVFVVGNVSSPRRTVSLIDVLPGMVARVNTGSGEVPRCRSKDSNDVVRNTTGESELTGRSTLD